MISLWFDDSHQPSSSSSSSSLSCAGSGIPFSGSFFNRQILFFQPHSLCIHWYSCSWKCEIKYKNKFTLLFSWWFQIIVVFIIFFVFSLLLLLYILFLIYTILKQTQYKNLKYKWKKKPTKEWSNNDKKNKERSNSGTPTGTKWILPHI